MWLREWGRLDLGFVVPAGLRVCLLWLVALIVACADEGDGVVEVTTTGDASVAPVVPRCGESMTAVTAPCARALCPIAPARCGDDTPWSDHECRFSSDCRDRGAGEPYCISTGAGTGCRCVQRCAFHEQCNAGQQCTCEVGKYGVCRSGDPPAE